MNQKEEKKMDQQTGSYLPTAEQIEKMDDVKFRLWIETAYEILSTRKQRRDPIFKLKKRISQILAHDYTEEQKEDRVYEEIEKHMLKELLNEPIKGLVNEKNDR